MQRCSCSVERTDTTWGISGGVCHISIVLFCKYTNHICVCHTGRTNYGDGRDLPPTIRMSSIFDKTFLLVRNIYDQHIIMILHMHVNK
jgi:hypothetical protein